MHTEYVEDKQLIELAAKAVELPECGWMGPAFMYVKDNQFIDWNPLDDSDDALRLAIDLELVVGHDSHDKLAYALVREPYFSASEFYGGTKLNPYAATRKAITRAAAEIGRNIK